MSKRVAWIDDMKLILMIFVAIDHCKVNADWDAWLLAWVMPAWFFIAGLTAHPRGPKSELKHRACALLVPYFCLYLITYAGANIKFLAKFILKRGFFEEHIVELLKDTAGALLFYNGHFSHRAINVLWFLPVLFWCHMLLSLAVSLIACVRGRWPLVLLFAILSAATFYIKGETLWLFSFGVRMLPIFALGYALSPFIVHAACERNRAVAIIKLASGALLLAVSFFVARKNGRAAFITGEGMGVLLLLSMSLGVAGITLFASSIKLAKWTRFFSYNTLIILPAHRFWGLPLVRKVLSIAGIRGEGVPMWQAFFMSLAAIALCAPFIYLYQHYCPRLQAALKRSCLGGKSAVSERG